MHLGRKASSALAGNVDVPSRPLGARGLSRIRLKCTVSQMGHALTTVEGNAGMVRRGGRKNRLGDGQVVGVRK